MHGNLMDRFDSDEIGPEALAHELADMLGGRRLYGDRRLGVLCWGLPPLLNLVPHSATDRQFVAACVAEAINRFEPRLEDVRVRTIDDATDFSFVIDAKLVEEDSAVSFRILSPHIGGALGAKVDVVTIRDGFGGDG